MRFLLRPSTHAYRGLFDFALLSQCFPVSSAVIRADNDTIEIGENTNIQNGAVIHTDPGHPVTIGKNVTIGHNAMFHGRSIGENSVIAIGAVVLSNAVIGKNCMIGANALVLENQTIPDASFVIGTGRIKATLSEQQIEAK